MFYKDFICLSEKHRRPILFINPDPEDKKLLRHVKISYACLSSFVHFSYKKDLILNIKQIWGKVAITLKSINDKLIKSYSKEFFFIKVIFFLVIVVLLHYNEVSNLKKKKKQFTNSSHLSINLHKTVIKGFPLAYPGLSKEMGNIYPHIFSPDGDIMNKSRITPSSSYVNRCLEAKNKNLQQLLIHWITIQQGTDWLFNHQEQ